MTSSLRQAFVKIMTSQDDDVINFVVSQNPDFVNKTFAKHVMRLSLITTRQFLHQAPQPIHAGDSEA